MKLSSWIQNTAAFLKAEGFKQENLHFVVPQKFGIYAGDRMFLTEVLKQFYCSDSSLDKMVGSNNDRSK